MSKLAELEFTGNFDQGFTVNLTIYENDQLNAKREVGISGNLPASNLDKLDENWSNAYQTWFDIAYKNAGFALKNREAIVNISVDENQLKLDKYHACQTYFNAENNLLNTFNNWLNSSEFAIIKESLKQHLNPNDANRILIKSNLHSLRRLPWQKWDLLETYTLTEIGLSSPNFRSVKSSRNHKKKVRILVILGKDANIQEEIKQLESLGDYLEIRCIYPQNVMDLDQPLWEENWDILLFNGHSKSNSTGTNAEIQLDGENRIFISLLRNHLQKAIKNGLRLAIFNSCDGLGIAYQLAEGGELYLPQVLVMRELLPIAIAPLFLRYFLEEFTKGNSLYKSVRETRNRLQLLENEHPALSWLPIICQQSPNNENPIWDNFYQDDNNYHQNKLILTAQGGYQIHCIFSNYAVIGRAKSCGFSIEDQNKNISKLQAVIEYKLDTNEYFIEDLGSTNGTFVNGVKLKSYEIQKLEHSSQIKLGSSLNFQFEYDPDSSDVCGVLIQYDSKGKENNRYVIIPKNQASVGTSANESIKFPKIQDECCFGKIVNEAGNFYFIDINNKENLLVHNKELSLKYLQVKVELNFIEEESKNTTDLIVEDNIQPTINYSDEELRKPSGEELPPNIRKINIVLGLVILVFGGLINFTIPQPDIKQIEREWIEESIKAINDPNSDNWRTEKIIFPPQENVTGVFTKSLKQDANKNYFLDKSGLSSKINSQTYLDFNKFNNLRLKNPNQIYLGIQKIDQGGFLLLEITYWTPDFYQKTGQATFEERKWAFLYGNSILIFLITVSVCGIIRYLIVAQYRHKNEENYNIFITKRTKEIYDINKNIELILQLAESGEIAKAMAKINDLLASVKPTHSVYEQMIDAKRKINAIKNQPIANNNFLPPNNIITAINQNAISKLLYLRIIGTPYAYQAPAGLNQITLGRKRAKIGSEGNDVCIRVPGNNNQSLRISRFHLKIEKIGDEYFVFALKEGRNKLNGKILKENQPYSLQSGDKLLIAGVLTLEVLFQVKMTGVKTNNIITINSPNEIQQHLEIEASIGDIITEFSYE